MNALPRLVRDEYDILCALVPLAAQRIVEIGCGDARLLRGVVRRHPEVRALAIEVDAAQHARNLADPQPAIAFAAAGADAIPAADGSFDLALMLKSLHHVPVAAMAGALDEVARVLVPGGQLYVSEPVYDGALNEIVRLFNDEGAVRAAAQAALDAALAGGRWRQTAEHRFAQPVRFADFDEFERRMMRPSWSTQLHDAATVERVRTAFAPHCGADGAAFERPMQVRLLRRER